MKIHGFGLMFLNAQDKPLYLQGWSTVLWFATHEGAYQKAEQLLPRMYKAGAVKAVIKHREPNTTSSLEWEELPILE